MKRKELVRQLGETGCIFPCKTYHKNIEARWLTAVSDFGRYTKNLSKGHRHADCFYRSPCSTHFSATRDKNLVP